MTLTEGIVTAAVGLVSGGIGSLIAPWVNWGIERKRLLRESRKQFLAQANAELNAGLSRDEYIASAGYARIKPYLSEKVVKWMHSPGINVVVSSGGGRPRVNPYIDTIAADLHRLEREWELI